MNILREKALAVLIGKGNPSNYMLLSKKIFKPLVGDIDNIAPDKSISHRSVIFASLAIGESRIYNLLEGEDVLRTIDAMRSMGVDIQKIKNYWSVQGVSISGLSEPKGVLEMGNSGTSTRLLMGLLSSFDFTSFFAGDKSLSKRPMKRVFDPIRKIGASIISHSDEKLPATIVGAKKPVPIEYELPVASAQVKSAILLAGINIPGKTIIYEPKPTRNHTEIMMRNFGFDIEENLVERDGRSVTRIAMSGQREFYARDFQVPCDISSASFFIVAALIVPDSRLLLKNICINPLRTGILTSLLEMGANIEFQNRRNENGEEVADIFVKYSELKGVEIPTERVPTMIDEYPIFSVAASFAEGRTTMRGLEELKVKESNRFMAIVENLSKIGVKIEYSENDIIIHGSRKNYNKLNDNVVINSQMDHRIAMSFIIMGLVVNSGIAIDDVEIIKTSFPNFIEIFSNLGVNFEEVSY